MKCYLCDEKATSVEHCPAQSFFPKGKRLNLITVPSCSLHNHDTALDDEYVRNAIAMTYGNNDVGSQHFRNKGMRSLQKSIGLFKQTVKEPKKLNFRKGDDNSKVLAFQVDRDRFDRVMRKTAYGLYFHKFNETWSYELAIAAHNLVTDNSDTDPIAERIRFHKQLRDSVKYEGSNPDVFKYSFLHFSKSHHKFLAMKFYDWFEVWAIPRENSTAPSLYS
jgi:hypothetical protein